MKIPGIFKMDGDQYRFFKALSEGAISDAHKSMCYYRDRRVTKRIPWKPQTPSMIAGEAAHCALLEPDRFEATYHPCTEKITAKSRKLIEETGKIPIKRDQYELYKSQAEYIRADETMQSYFYQGYPEHCLVWEINGRRCKTKPDQLFEYNGIPVVVSVKTIGDGKGIDLRDERAVKNEAARQRWRLGTGWQSIGVQAVFGRLPLFYYLVVRLAYPHEDNITLIQVPLDEQEANVRLCMSVFRQLDRCLETDTWPAKRSQPFELTTPEWQRRQDEAWEME